VQKNRGNPGVCSRLLLLLQGGGMGTANNLAGAERPFLELDFSPLAPNCAGPDELLAHLYFRMNRRVLVTGDASPANVAWLRLRYGDTVRIIGCPPRVVVAAIERRFRDVFRRRAVRDLAESEPQFSASTVITRGQTAALAVSVAVAFLLLFAAPQISSIAFAGISGALFVANAVFRGILLWIGAEEPPPAPAFLSEDAALPIYSILVPLYREANVMPALVRALRALDYPKERLDIKLIVEADDRETAIVADAIAARDAHFSVIRVPPGTPRTKPRACNYAMPFVLGEFTVIFDAEDRPEPDQLRKAVAAFRAAPDNIACLQARLNFYNANENWLTRMFALDYALWFDYLLPGLDRLNIPMPLGGTSNHFRTAALRAIHCWDPYNVTEDADIGIRLARVGLRVRTLDSTTFEEATNDFGNWLRQRSRWLKGYMQTWLVHMRSPLALLRNAGLGGFIGFQLFVGGTFLSALANPVLWAIFLLSKFFGAHLLSAPAAAMAAHVSIVGLAAGNGMFAYLAMLAPFRRGWLELTPYGLTAPVYWLLISCAGARALWQLFFRPWYWEKTAHGLSKVSSA
jgi:cellulose synthase/poly-beta-1,6-N-acetylglucosamine synthase-like glycosyltransferase